MIITDKKIKQLALEKELITPFSEKNLQSESYDVTIGTEITVMKKEIRCLDISEQKGIDGIYEHIEISNDGYTISPKQYLLISLGETINIPNNLTAHLRPKTSYTRLGLIVSSQHCNSTYKGHLRIGVFNATDYPIHIKAGYPIAQLVFEELDEIPSEDKQYKNKKNAHYQNENGAFRGAKFDDKYLEELWDRILDNLD